MGEAMTGTCRERRMAVLVLHGLGQQAKFDALASFAAGLARQARVTQVARTPLLIDDRMDSALTVRVGDVHVDLVEYHYQPMMQRQVDTADVTRWLAETSYHIRHLYRTYNFGTAGPVGARRLKAGTDQHFPEPNGDFLDFHYMLRNRGHWLAPAADVLARALRHLEHLRKESPWRWIFSPVVNVILRPFLDTLMKEVAGDLIIYTAIDPNLRLNPVRQTILDGCVDRIEGLILCPAANDAERPRYEKVFVAGHSLGSVVAYDAISRIAMRADHLALTGLGRPAVTRVQARRLDGLITFGSPLDKVALMFWPREDGALATLQDNIIPNSGGEWSRRRILYRQGLLAHFHGIRGLSPAVRLPKEVTQPENTTFADLPWLNLYHGDDLISGHLDAFQGVMNVAVQVPVTGTGAISRTAQAHGIYWSQPDMYAWLIERIGAAHPDGLTG